MKAIVLGMILQVALKSDTTGELSREIFLLFLSTACEYTLILIQISIKGIYFWCQSWASGLFPCAHGCPVLQGEPPFHHGRAPSQYLQIQAVSDPPGALIKGGMRD